MVAGIAADKKLSCAGPSNACVAVLYDRIVGVWILLELKHNHLVVHAHGHLVEVTMVKHFLEKRHDVSNWETAEV